MVRTFRHALYGLAAFLGVIGIGGVVLAQAAPTFPPTLVGVQARGPVSGGLSVMATFRAMPGTGAANSAFFSVPATLSPTTVGTLARGVMSRAAPAAAVAGVIAAAGWAFNSLQQQVEIPAVPGTPLGAHSWSLDIHLGAPVVLRYATTPEQFIGTVLTPFNVNSGPFTVTSISPQTASRALAVINNGAVGGATISLVSTPPGAVSFDGRAAAPVPLADLGNAMLGAPQSWPALLTNADGSPVRTPELVTAAQALATQLAQGTQPSPDTGWDTGFQGGEPLPSPSPSPSPTPSPNPQPVELTFPVFCEWASSVCQFIDWMRESAPAFETVPMPMEDLETLRVPWSSGLGGGSCPTVAPVVLRDGWEVSIPVTVMCDLATLLRPVLILLASLLAVFILVGGVRAP